MIQIPTSPAYHYIGDLLAWLGAFAGGRWFYAHHRARVESLARQTAPSYFVSLAVGAAIGAWVFGSLNLVGSDHPTLSHSIAGALVGAIVAVEGWKAAHGVRVSTGGPFVIPLSLGIIIGRWGCLFAGLDDQTFGVPTQLPWGIDLGDGVSRHPVQLYESLSIAAFLALYWRALSKGQHWADRHGFHAFVLAYAVQRFTWEFLKPYPKLIGPFNLFHLLMMGLGGYALIWIARGKRRSALPRT